MSPSIERKPMSPPSDVMQRNGEYTMPIPSSITRGDFRSGNNPRATDVFIAVMGVTGAGKSTFISLCSEQKVKIGHGLKSCKCSPRRKSGMGMKLNH